VKKPSKWKLSFGKSSGGRVSPVEETSQSTEVGAVPMTVTASNVSNLIMGLDAPPPPGSSPKMGDSTWNRGRRMKQPIPLALDGGAVGGRANTSCSPQTSLERSMNGDPRAVSPASTRSGQPLASSASSVVSANWRSSVASSAATSTSAFTRYSNSSMRSVSTTATSVSASSWRTHGGSSPPVSNTAPQTVPGLPKNVKYMTGTPWELGRLPRGFHTNVSSETPIRKHRVRKPKELPLDTINERPANAGSKSPVAQRRDASTSTTDLSGGIARDSGGKEDADTPKKVQRGQINALAKMLSALRR